MPQVLPGLAVDDGLARRVCAARSMSGIEYPRETGPGAAAFLAQPVVPGANPRTTT